MADKQQLTKENEGMSLSDRVRPGSEAAPWVVDSIKALEAEKAATLARIAELERENAELKAKVAFMQNENPSIVGWPWDSPYMDGVEAGKAELESALAKSASREVALVEKLKVATAALDSIEGGGGVQGETATAALAKIKEAS